MTYTIDQQRAADYIVGATAGTVGGGDDPVGFILSSHAGLRDQNKRLKEALKEIVRSTEPRAGNNDVFAFSIAMAALRDVGEKP